MNLADIRKSYLLHSLDENDTGNDPLAFFMRWLSEAVESKVEEPTAMVLSTVNNSNKPSSRVVLLKGCEEGEFRFFTNYESRKGQEISENPYGSLLFFWKELERQVRVEGIINKMTEEASDAYFNTRPIESRIGAIVSPQSKVIENREILEQLFITKSSSITEATQLRRPENWGGYALKPELIEFWQGRASRLHDRIRFRLQKGIWIKDRLAP